MNPLNRRFQLQLLFAFLAAVAVSLLTIGLVMDAVHHAEGFVLTDTSRTLNHAIEELRREYKLRIHGDSSWGELPPAAQDVTLRAISQTVLNSFPGVEGGFWSQSRFLGYSYPTHDGGLPKVDVPESERSAIEDVIRQARSHRRGKRVLRGKYDLVVISAASDESSVTWAMKRLPGQAEPAQRTRIHGLPCSLACPSLARPAWSPPASACTAASVRLPGAWHHWTKILFQICRNAGMNWVKSVRRSTKWLARVSFSRPKSGERTVRAPWAE